MACSVEHSPAAATIAHDDFARVAIDLGAPIGIKRSSAQITVRHGAVVLIGPSHGVPDGGRLD